MLCCCELCNVFDVVVLVWYFNTDWLTYSFSGNAVSYLCCFFYLDYKLQLPLSHRRKMFSKYLLGKYVNSLLMEYTFISFSGRETQIAHCQYRIYFNFNVEHFSDVYNLTLNYRLTHTVPELVCFFFYQVKVN